METHNGGKGSVAQKEKSKELEVVQVPKELTRLVLMGTEFYRKLLEADVKNFQSEQLGEEARGQHTTVSADLLDLETLWQQLVENPGKFSIVGHSRLKLHPETESWSFTLNQEGGRLPTNPETPRKQIRIFIEELREEIARETKEDLIKSLGLTVDPATALKKIAQQKILPDVSLKIFLQKAYFKPEEPGRGVVTTLASGIRISLFGNDFAHIQGLNFVVASPHYPERPLLTADNINVERDIEPFIDSLHQVAFAAK